MRKIIIRIPGHPASICTRTSRYRDTQFALALNLMISRRGERSLVLRSHLRAAHHINYGGHPCHLQSRALMSQIAWLPYVYRARSFIAPCSVYVRWAVLSRRSIMWDKLYARKSFHRERANGKKIAGRSKNLRNRARLRDICEIIVAIIGGGDTIELRSYKMRLNYFFFFFFFIYPASREIENRRIINLIYYRLVRALLIGYPFYRINAMQVNVMS